jgi:hypothetical protein
MARLISVNVGLPRDIVWKERTVHTGVWKNPVSGRSHVSHLNLQGDGQGDLAPGMEVSIERSSFIRLNPIAIGRSS